MFMLIPSEVVPDCYTMAMTDAATSGSTTSLLTNICESASILDPWEVALPKAKATLSKFGYSIDDDEAETYIKHFYQTLRHGLSVDWVLNNVCSSILNVFPYSRAFEFNGTRSFLNRFGADPVFKTELDEISRELDVVLDWVFEGFPDRYVYRRLYQVSERSPEYALYMLTYLSELSDGSPYVIPAATSYRVAYLVLLLEMITDSIGFAKRTQWHNYFDQIQSGEFKGVLVTGCKFEAFAYGNLNNEGPRWHRLENGIRMLGLSGRQHKTDYVRAFADEMTFFRFANDALLIDETLFPQVSFDDGATWLNATSFKDSFSCDVDKAMRMRIRYPFKPMPKDVGKKTIKVRGSASCVVRHELLTLDENNEAETQVIFRAANSSFKIVDTDKKYPFTFFTCSAVRIESLEWL